MIVYVELVFLENFIVDYCLLLLAGRLAGTALRRPALAALCGALYACVMPLWDGFLLVPCRAIVLILMLLPAYRVRSVRQLALTAGANALLFCALYGLVKLAGQPIRGVIYREDGVFLLALLSLLCAVILFRLLGTLLKKSKLRDLYAVLQIGNTRIPALVDSGNSLYYAGLPVVLVERGALKQEPEKPLIIPYRAVETHGALIGFRPREVYLHRGQEVTSVHCIVALCDRPFGRGVHALLHPDMIKEPT